MTFKLNRLQNGQLVRYFRKRILNLNSIVLLVLLIASSLYLHNCSGTEIPNGISSDDKEVADNDKNSTDSITVRKISGQVSRGTAVDQQFLYVIDKGSKMIGRVQTDSEGNFTLSSATLGEHWNEIEYPLILLTSTEPALLTSIAEPAAAEPGLYVNPITSETLRNTLIGVDLDRFSLALQNTSFQENETGIIFINSLGDPVSVPALNLESTFAQQFRENGETLVNAVFGTNAFVSENDSAFELFWGTQSAGTNNGGRIASESIVSAGPMDGPTSELINILMLSLGALGDIESVIQEAVNRPSESGNLLNKAKFLNQISANAFLESASTSIFAPIASAHIEETIINTKNVLASASNLYNPIFLQPGGKGAGTQAVLEPQSCVSISSAARVQENRASASLQLLTVSEITELSKADEQRVLTQAIAQILTESQQANPNAFLDVENTNVLSNVSTLGADTLTTEINRVFALEEIASFLLQPFVDVIVGPIGISIGSIPDLPNLDLSSVNQDNVITAARNIGVYLEEAYRRIDSDSNLTNSQKLVVARQVSVAIQKIIEGKDISNQNGGLDANDKQEIYCNVMAPL
ncbi:MAG: hypothetical protein HQM13_11940 [SAR324 cluster bacterium]|nr:hypothetical protein [SAR324 cluster bacterium]